MAVPTAKKTWRQRAGVIIAVAMVFSTVASAMISSSLTHDADRRAQQLVDWRAEETNLARAEKIASDSFARGLFLGHKDGSPKVDDRLFATNSDLVIETRGHGMDRNYRIRRGQVLMARGNESVAGILPAGCTGFNPYNYGLASPAVYDDPSRDPRTVSCGRFWEGSPDYTQRMSFF